jgi:hypothetical protein
MGNGQQPGWLSSRAVSPERHRHTPDSGLSLPRAGAVSFGNSWRAAAPTAQGQVGAGSEPRGASGTALAVRCKTATGQSLSPVLR